MLKHRLLHPDITAILARAGHHAKILIADGNYPASTMIGPNAQLVSLNLAPGIVTVSQVLETLLTAIVVDEINTMGVPPEDAYAIHGEPAIWGEFRRIVQGAGLPLELKPIEKWQFYDAVMSRDHVLTIQTGDQALWANVLLSLGCRTE